MTRSRSDHTHYTREASLTIEIVTERTGVSARRLRGYEKQGLIRGSASSSGHRIYSLQTVERIEQIDRLTTELGVNLAGAEVILNMRERMLELLDEIERLQSNS